MDEAVLRIVLEDAGGTGGGTGNIPPTPPPAPQVSSLQPPVSQQPRYQQPQQRTANPQPVNVDAAKPSKPVPPQSTQLPPQPPQPPPVDWVKSLIDPAEGVNPHVLLEGQSGSGKSLMAKHIAFKRMAMGQDVRVVDTHTPESWGGAKQVFQGPTAGTDAADFLKKALQTRKEEATQAKLRGESPKFDPMTVVFSDFARLMRDTPKLGEEFRTLLTEARKFRISIVADTTALTGASSGIKGIQDVLNNFGQKVKFYAPTAQGDPRRAEVAGQTYATPQLPDYKERIDYTLVKPPKPLPPPQADEPFDPRLEARKRREREVKKTQVDAAYREQYGEEEKQETKLDTVINVANSLRGTIGGVFGTVVGAVVDVVSFIHKSREEAAKVRRDQDLVTTVLPSTTAVDTVSAPTAQEVPQAPPVLAEAPTKTTTLAPPIKTTALSKPVTTALASPPTTTPVQSAPTPPVVKPAPPPVSGAGAAASGIGPTMGGFAASAGPVGIAVVAALAIDQAVKGAIKGVVGGVGGFAKAMSSPDDSPSAAIEGLSHSITSFGEKIPGIGQALVAVGETGKMLAGLMQAFSKQAEKYAEYNPQIAQQLAMAEIRQVMGDMRRAQRAGPELARFIEEQSRMQQQFEEIKMKIWMKILPVITAILQILGRLLNVVEEQDDDEKFKTPTETLLSGGVQVPLL